MFMTGPTATPATLLCVASFFKGNDFIRECRRAGARVVLLTREKLLGEAWARECLDQTLAVPDGGGCELYQAAAALLARRRRVARVVALEEYDVVTAARIREHLCLPGMSATTARLFQDKLAMRAGAREGGLRVPEFVRLLNDEEIAEFISRVAPPWMLKPRRGASAMGMRRLEGAGEAWRALSELDARAALSERPAHHLLEQFIPGDVYHVDALSGEGRVVFASVERYGAPPFAVAHGGGVATSCTVERGSDDERRLLALNEKLLAAFGFERGATHAEFIKSDADGEFHFLEVAARVGGAHTVETVEAATGVNLWREWAQLELSTPERPYALPPARADYAGLAISLAREEWPDTSAYDDPEIVYRVRKPWHVGLIVRSPRHGRVAELTANYARRFARDFTAVAPPEETACQHL
jgi:biotin carboxylase